MNFKLRRVAKTCLQNGVIRTTSMHVFYASFAEMKQICPKRLAMNSKSSVNLPINRCLGIKQNIKSHLHYAVYLSKLPIPTAFKLLTLTRNYFAP